MLDVTIHKGRPDRPAVIFIHGLGMDKRIWVNPDDARILGGSLPLKYILSKKPASILYKQGVVYKRFTVGDRPEVLGTSFTDLLLSGYTVAAWSQKRPAGPMDIAVEELREMINKVNRHSKAGIILIGHSRGGLIARKYLETADSRVRGLITIATPHMGSSIAKWVQYISPLASSISPLIHEGDRKKFSFTVKRILNFIGGKAIRELLPDSEFFRLLKPVEFNGMFCMSFGGTSPSLFTIYRWKIKDKGRGKGFEPEALFSFPDILEMIIPKRLFPDELRNGHGDGLVSAHSSKLPYCDNHYNYRVNHAGILFNERVRERIANAVKDI
ncbi:MAG: alpha/beta fold hydrolase [Nitrospirae bacterium]|nr:alpha/beta fold hydrolase [Nitrospirota bacterium]